jgi:hypothetical protein
MVWRLFSQIHGKRFGVCHVIVLSNNADTSMLLSQITILKKTKQKVYASV